MSSDPLVAWVVRELERPLPGYHETRQDDIDDRAPQMARAVRRLCLAAAWQAHGDGRMLGAKRMDAKQTLAVEERAMAAALRATEGSDE